MWRPETHWIPEQDLGVRKCTCAVLTLLGWVAFGSSSYAAYEARSVICVHRECLLNGTTSEGHSKLSRRTAIAKVDSVTPFVSCHFVVSVVRTDEAKTGPSH